MTAGDIRRAVKGEILVASSETMEVVEGYKRSCDGEGYLVVKRSTALSGETEMAQVLGPDTGEGAVCLPCQWERNRCAVVRISEVLSSVEAEKRGLKGGNSGACVFISPSWGRDEPHH